MRRPSSIHRPLSRALPSLSRAQSPAPGDGSDGNICGDTGLGFQSAMLDAAAGYGMLHDTDGTNVVSGAA